MMSLIQSQLPRDGHRRTALVVSAVLMMIVFVLLQATNDDSLASSHLDLDPTRSNHDALTTTSDSRGVEPLTFAAQVTSGTSNRTAAAETSEGSSSNEEECINLSRQCGSSEQTTDAQVMEQEKAPLSRQTLGHATWSLLHTMAALYPEEPSPEKQSSMRAFITALSDLYPCVTCGRHFRAYLASHPLPSPLSRASLTDWLCQSHNAVNERLGKPLQDCAAVDERWPAALAPDCDCAPADEEEEVEAKETTAARTPTTADTTADSTADEPDESDELVPANDTTVVQEVERIRPPLSEASRRTPFGRSRRRSSILAAASAP